jgi:hypothetical protein
MWLSLAPATISAAPIPLEEEFVFAQSLHVDASWEALTFLLFDDTGLFDVTGTAFYSSVFSFSEDLEGNVTGGYLGMLTGTYLGFTVTGEYEAVLAMEALNTVFELKSKIIVIDQDGNKIKELTDTGRLVEAADDTATVEIEVEDENGNKITIVNDADKLTKSKDDLLKKLTVRGTVIVKGEPETFKLDLDQTTMTYVSLILTPGVPAWRNKGTFAAFDDGFTTTLHNYVGSSPGADCAGVVWNGLGCIDASSSARMA